MVSSMETDSGGLERLPTLIRLLIKLTPALIWKDYAAKENVALGEKIRKQCF